MSAVRRPALIARVARRLRRGTARRHPVGITPGDAQPGQADPRPVRSREVPADAVYPEVVEEHTNVGPAMDAIVTRAKRNQEPLGHDPDYDLVRENFDHLNFMLQAESLHEQADADPIRIFLRNGPRAVNSPNYNFSMKNYLDRHPERRSGPEESPYLEWLKHGRDAGEVADPAQGIEKMAVMLGLQPAEVVDELVATRTDMMERLRTGKLGEMFAKAAEVEPLVGAAWVEATKTNLLPLRGRAVVGQVAAIHACQTQAGFRRARVVVVTDRPPKNGGRGPVSHLAHGLSLTVAPDEVVVIYTDEAGAAPPGLLPAQVRQVDFATAARRLPAEHQEQALVSLLRSFQADAVVNVESDVFYAALTPYGKAMAASERIFLHFLCDEQRPPGHWDGSSMKWFYAAYDYAAGFIADSDHLRDRLTDTYQLSQAQRERIHVLRTPVEPLPERTPHAAPDGSRPRVDYWAGGWERRRRLDIALDVAGRMPDVDFVFHGSPADRRLLRDLPENVLVEDEFTLVRDLDLSQTAAWLYTSAWDGVPGVLLEVAMTEVPIVGSLVGGVGEVLCDQDSWPIADWEDAQAYEKGLRQVLSDPAGSRRRSRALRERLERDRPERAYGEDVADLLLEPAHRAEGAR